MSNHKILVPNLLEFVYLVYNRERDDYEKRGGLTSFPLSSHNFNEAPRPLHLKLRVLSWFETFLYRSTAKVHKWNDGIIKDYQDKAINRSKKFIQV